MKTSGWQYCCQPLKKYIYRNMHKPMVFIYIVAYAQNMILYAKIWQKKQYKTVYNRITKHMHLNCVFLNT